MEKVPRQFDCQTKADEGRFLDDNRLTSEERLAAFMQVMSPCYHASAGLQRVYRTDDLESRKIRDDWRLATGDWRLCLHSPATKSLR